ncbi:MAG: hypothetical protein UV40_C0013G0004 [Parcubacteria group bacterium GW2011_GWA1_42_7]|nr:MAG: hypothetical protein UV34_C0029G0018 [Parcubacteria group bacterium GW2011_GWB1_42_6]KKS69859.1 MAG: hypothetical protein UV40_C0013G0004 [Parcubacteria group bacterium GW2011_GWA1_42_7]KKS91590.1 MAG: hypothetical protein UV67_C0024G0004 [Parcubacteria group bacterium GW2011_GWC1_43_12]
MKNIKKNLIDETANEITAKEQEIQESDRELEILSVKIKVENKALGMQDLREDLEEDFKYSVQALESMLVQEQRRNIELKKDLEILKYRREVIESQFSDNELDR